MQGNGRELRLISGQTVAAEGPASDPYYYQTQLVEAYVTSQVARGFSDITIENGTGILERFLARVGRPVWEVTKEDIDRVAGELASQGIGSTTRRSYIQAFKSFHRFVSVRKAFEIEAFFGVRIEDPLDEFNSSRHVALDSPATRPPPSEERMEQFFDFLKNRIAGARKYSTAARDYTLFRTLYHAGLRAEEAASLEIRDLHFTRGPFGKIHVRFGKGAKTSGPRPRWVPMLDGLDLILKWFLSEVRPRFHEGPRLLCDEGGDAIHRGTIRNRLRYLMQLEGDVEHERFSPHDLRHACATRNYERGVDLNLIAEREQTKLAASLDLKLSEVDVAIQQMLGHWHVGTTMRYVTPSATFIEDAYRRAVSNTINELEEEPNAD